MGRREAMHIHSYWQSRTRSSSEAASASAHSMEKSQCSGRTENCCGLRRLQLENCEEKKLVVEQTCFVDIYKVHLCQPLGVCVIVKLYTCMGEYVNLISISAKICVQKCLNIIEILAIALHNSPVCVCVKCFGRCVVWTPHCGGPCH